MKIYTGTGDKGKTSLFGGERVLKSDRQVDAYGDIDELNAFLGALSSFLDKNDKNDKKRISQIQDIQSELMNIGAWLATPPTSPVIESLNEIAPEGYRMLEESIDQMDARLEPLKEFILPGGHISASFAHIARTVCRRAERKMTDVWKKLDAGKSKAQIETGLVYINRLSDYLFVLARICNIERDVEDIVWKR